MGRLSGTSPFGAAAAASGARSAPCPCGGGASFERCCAPYVLDGMPAPTAEALMRSRYVAHALGLEAHLRRTWHPATRPRRAVLDAATRWARLEVVKVTAGGVDDATGVVAFRAHWSVGSGTGRRQGVLEERSAFARRGNRWVYVGPDEGP